MPSPVTDPNTTRELVLIDAIQALCREKLSLRIDSPETDLFQTGVLDSMTLVQLIVLLEQQFQLTLPLHELTVDSFRSVSAIARFLAGRASAAAGRPA